MKRYIVTLLVSVSCGGLTGCPSLHQPEKPDLVNIPISVACAGQAPIDPKYTFGAGDFPVNGGKPDETQAARDLYMDVQEAKRYISGLKAQYAGCK
ncbi:MAG: hypothetical protein JO253_06030 [Alphaproteobacteria bacterium]|nr:hypothetical protein [Alphaproteobacteria bacterium]